MPMKNKFFSAALFLSLVFSPSFSWAQKEQKKPEKQLTAPLEYTIDKKVTKVSFEVAHLVVSKVKGEFTDFKGNFHFDPNDFSKTTLVAEANPRSVDTGNKSRDEDLRGPRFFDVERCPIMSFKSDRVSAIQKAAQKNSKVKTTFDLEGEMIIRCTPKHAIFHVTYVGEVKEGDRIGQKFEAVTEIDRQAYGLKFQNFVDIGPVIGNKVKITVTCEGFKESKL